MGHIKFTYIKLMLDSISRVSKDNCYIFHKGWRKKYLEVRFTKKIGCIATSTCCIRMLKELICVNHLNALKILLMCLFAYLAVPVNFERLCENPVILAPVRIKWLGVSCKFREVPDQRGREPLKEMPGKDAGVQLWFKYVIYIIYTLI